ncbi:MAG: polymerase subunit sigma-24, partial [Actinomycetia bacterium]|nr:polymerase subunit sigma-24 [Actinomycetes bacterium]
MTVAKPLRRSSGNRGSGSVAMRADEIDLAEDRRLVEAWQAGDATAFDDLYRRYFGRLRGYCERRVGSAAAEEVAQDAFVKALQALPRLSGERRFYPWLTVIAGRLCIDHHRKHGRIQPCDVVDAGSIDDGHDARLSLQADLDALDRALRRLGPRHAEVLDLRERRGLTYHQIASQLGVPHSTVEALLFRARRALRREFEAVSIERLAGVPALGWVVTRLGRVRDRLAGLGPELGALGGTLAAGAVTAVLVALPAASTPPAVLATQHRPAPVTATAVAPTPPPAPSLA